MSALRKSNTLFQAVPALGAISAHGTGRAKLMPVGFEHPGFELVDGVNRFGRDPARNHHVILSSHVSRCHCEVLVSGDAIWVRDLGSHNGTYVNGERISEKELLPGDKLGLSRRVMMLLVMDAELQKPIGVAMNIEKPEPAPSAPASPASSAEPIAAQASAPALPPHLFTAPEPCVPDSGNASNSAFIAPAPVAARPPPSGLQSGSVPPSAVVSGVIQKVPSAADKLREASVADPEERALDQATQIKELEQQRNVLAILYQISLRCLMAENGQEAEKLIANVLQRLVPLESGFILFQTGGGWRASICPDSKDRPSDQTVQGCYQLAIQQRAPAVIEDAGELESLGLEGHGSAMAVPLMFNGEVVGVIGAIAAHTGVYTPALVDIVVQIANISAAALRD